MQIYPSILETSSDAFFTQLSAVLLYFNHIQIDITDGIFVPQKTVQIEQLDNLLSEKPSFAKASAGKTFEFHLMVNDYKKEIEKLQILKEKIKIISILVHLKALVLDPSRPLGDRDDMGWKYGIVLNPEDSVVDNWEIIKQFETVQLMTVHPGQQGSLFVPGALDKIGELRTHGFTGKIILDGAMNDKTLPIVLQKKYLPDAICPGSYFKSDVENRLEKLRKMIKEKLNPRD